MLNLNRNTFYDKVGHLQRIHQNPTQNPLPIAAIKRMSNRLRIEIEKITQLFDFMTRTHINTPTHNITNTATASSSSSPSNVTYAAVQNKLKNLLDEIKNKLHIINEIHIQCEKNLLNEKFAKQLDEEWSSLEKTMRESTITLLQQARILKPSLSDTQNHCLEIILTDIQKTFQQDSLALDKSFTKAELIQRLSHKLCEHTLSTLTHAFNPSPTCFISYSWSSAANVKKVHKIARSLKAAGIKVILDVWHNTTGSIHAFTENIKTADYVIVVGTPDLVEKWNNFSSSGASRGKTEKNYQGNVVCAELEMILTRLNDKGNNNHGIINLLLQGEHKSSFPNRFTALPSSDNDFTTNNLYTESLFNLLLKLAPKNLDAKSSAENHRLLIEQKRKELREKLKAIQTLSDAELLSLYQENIENKKNQKTLIAEIQQDLISLKSLKESQAASLTTATVATATKTATIVNEAILWNIPSQHHVFIGRETLLEELHQELGIQPKTAAQTDAKFKLKTLAIAAFSGLGGIGKTQLALKYIRDTTHPYTLKAWFQAEKIEELKQSLIEFAKSRGYSDEKVTFETAFLYLKQWLTKNPDWLIVYDNVNSYEEIEHLLPDGGGSIILTSRNHEWPNGFKKLDIRVMTEEESIRMIQSIIKRDKELTETKELAKILGYLPLAMAQASAYIAKKHKSISDYLKLYKTQQVKLLADKTFPKGTNHLSVATTWNITLEILSKEARELLNVCAYLAPDKIPKALLLTWLKKAHPEIKEPEDVIDDYLSPLEQYSFIKYDGYKYIRVHRLVQAILRHQHQASGQQGILKWYNVLLNAANTEFCQDTQVLENIARRNQLMPHLYSLVEHFEANWPNNPSFEFANILHSIGFALLTHLADYRNALTYFDKCLKICRPVASNELTFIATVLNNLANTYGYLGNYQKQKELLEQALTIKERNFGKEHVELASTLHSLGNAYGNLGNTQKQIELLEQALTIKERNFGKEHVELASTLASLGNVYGYFGNTQKQKELLEQALTIYDRHYVKEHLSIDMCFTLWNLAIAYKKCSEIEKAYRTAQRCLAVYKNIYGEQHSETKAVQALLKEYEQVLIKSTQMNKTIRILSDALAPLDYTKKHYQEDNGQESFVIAENYYCGQNGYSKDLNEALKHYNASAALGFAPAKAKLGYLYQLGIGVVANIKLAIEYYQAAAAQGNDNAECRLGYCYQIGLCVEKNENKALELFKLSASKKNPIAQYYLAKYYEQEGPNQNVFTAQEYYNQALDGGYDYAKPHLIELIKKYPQLKNRTKDLAKESIETDNLIRSANEQKKTNPKIAIDKYLQALTLKEKMYGEDNYELLTLLTTLKDLYIQLKDSSKAKILEERIKKINGKTFFNTAEKHYYGKDGVNKNLKFAIQYYSAAAAHNNADAQAMLGYLYLQGNCENKNQNDAIKLFLSAVEQNNPKAQFFLGYCYLYGNGIDKDEVRAITFLKLAANQGIQSAHKLLGECYESGLGVLKNLNTAYSHFSETENADNDASAFLKRNPSFETPKPNIGTTLSLNNYKTSNNTAADKANNIGLRHTLSYNKQTEHSASASLITSITPENRKFKL